MFLVMVLFVMMVITWSLTGHDKYSATLFIYQNFLCSFSLIASVIVFIHWLRATMIIKASELLTPFYKILGHMLWDIVKFLSLTGICFFMFSFAFSIYFRQLGEYATIRETVFELFFSMLGEMNFEAFDPMP